MNASRSWRLLLLLLLLLNTGCGPEASAPPARTTPRLRPIETRGFDDPANVGAVCMAEARDALYLGTWNAQHGGKIYRTEDGEQWRVVNQGGFGRRNNFCILSLARHGDHLYAGTWNMKGRCGLHRMRLPAGRTPEWQPVTEDGFGDEGNKAVTCLGSFRGHLYAGCYNPRSGAEVWRSRNGDPGAWHQVNADGFNEERTSDATHMLEHQGHLYVSTESLRVPGRGCQIWRTDGRLDRPGPGWQLVLENGFGSADNVNIRAMTRFRGRLYAATWNTRDGIEVWRIRPGAATPFAGWERVARGGFLDARYYMSTALATLGDELFLSAVGKHRFDGNAFEADVNLRETVGGLVMKTGDGLRWERIDRPGFLRSPLVGAASLAAFRGRLFIGSMALDRPLQVWVYR